MVNQTLIDSLSAFAEQRSAEYQFQLGLVFESDFNYNKAFLWFEKAAQQGHSYAQLKVGHGIRNSLKF